MIVVGTTYQKTVDREDGDLDHMMLRNDAYGGHMGLKGDSWQMHQSLGLVTWLLLIALMAAATRYLWNKG